MADPLPVGKGVVPLNGVLPRKGLILVLTSDGGLGRSTDGCREMPLSLLAARVYRSTLLSLLGGLL